MTRDEFIRQMATIEAHIKMQCEVSKFFNETFFKDSTPSVFEFATEVLDLATTQLSDLSGIDCDTVVWLLYEGGGKCTHPAVGERMIRTAGELWDAYQKNDTK